MQADTEGSQHLDTMIFDELYLDSVSSVAQAVHSDNMQLLQELLQNGHCTSVTDNRGWTPLHVAASKGCVEAVRHLLMADDIRVDSLSHRGDSALYLACCGQTEGHRKIVELLLSAGADPDMVTGVGWDVPLHAAIENNNIEIVKLLLDAGADPNIETFKSTTALHAAAEVGALVIAQLLLEKDADLNCKQGENSALHCLCLNYKKQCGDSPAIFNSMLDLFLLHGSDINAQTSDGSTPLMLAVQAGWEWAVDRLLDRGADVHLTKNSNILALHFAIQFTSDLPERSSVEDEKKVEHSSVLQKILSCTSHDRIPQDSFSVFHLAIQWKRYGALRMLIEDGINPDNFLQEMENAIIDCDDDDVVPLIVELHTSHDTPLGFLLFQSLTQEVVDTAKYMIEKGSSINALQPHVLPPLVAALRIRHPGAYQEDGLGQEILQYLLARGVDIMHKTSESDLLPAALAVSSLFNAVGFFRLLQHGVPAHSFYTHATLTALMEHYQAVQCYRVNKMFPWMVVSWVRTANLFVAQLPIGTSDIFNTGWDVEDESLTQAWQQVETLISSPKSLQHLCVLEIRRVLGEGRGWEKLQHSLKQLHNQTVLPDPILDLLHFRWVKTDSLQLSPPSSSRHLYFVTVSPSSSSDEEL